MDHLAPDRDVVLDLDHLARQTFADRELEREVLILFDGQCDRLLPVIANTGAPGARRDAVHTLKGAARAIGAGQVAAAAEALEGALDRLGGSDGALDPLTRAIGDARVAIARRIGT